MILFFFAVSYTGIDTIGKLARFILKLAKIPVTSEK